MKTVNGIWFSCLIMALSGMAIACLAPYFPIDETRYLTVAWEMKLNHSFFVPFLNGLPYSHKPPFLFWLINLNWFGFGVNETTLRMIPLLFGLFNTVLVYRIALMIWEDETIARDATIIFSSTLIYLIWSALIMFDVILSFWVLVGMYGFLSAAKKEKITSWIIVGISMGGGLLTKGPAVFIHILPVGLLYFLWCPKNTVHIKRWYLNLLLSIGIGMGIALAWAIPASVLGGETYRNAILWGQTANRVISSFSHQRPIWWYLPLFPVLFLPWALVKPSWPGYSELLHNKPSRFVVVWILSTLALFSCISGKQIHYLIPMVSAGSMMIAKNMAAYRTKIQGKTRWHYPVAILYITLGVAALLLPLIKLGSDVGDVPFTTTLLLSIGFIFLGGMMLVVKIASMDQLIKVIAVSSLVACMVMVYVGKSALFHRYDLGPVSHILNEKQAQGYQIIHFGKYEGQYQFLARLTDPIVVFNDGKSIGEYIKGHDNVVLIAYQKQDAVIEPETVLYQQPYRGRKVVLLEKKQIHHFLESGL